MAEMRHRQLAHSAFIDGFSFAESGGALQGRWPIAGFDRLQDVLISNRGDLEYEVRGTRDALGRSALRVRLSGRLELTCRRCLGALAYPLEIDALLVLARSEAEIEAQPLDPDDPDRVVGRKEMAVGALLEDEVLLAVPVAPHHAACSAADDRRGEAQASPFANLRGLLNRGRRARN